MDTPDKPRKLTATDPVSGEVHTRTTRHAYRWATNLGSFHYTKEAAEKYRRYGKDTLRVFPVDGTSGDKPEDPRFNRVEGRPSTAVEKGNYITDRRDGILIEVFYSPSERTFSPMVMVDVGTSVVTGKPIRERLDYEYPHPVFKFEADAWAKAEADLDRFEKTGETYSR